MQSDPRRKMTLRTAVIIATKERPQSVSNLLDALARQTVHPDVIVVSACDPSDIDTSSVVSTKNIQVLFGSAGLTAQRNRALSLVLGRCDVVVFFDDDFIPSRFWIERVQVLLTTQPDIGGVTGHVLMDGVTTGELAWSDGQAMVDQADSSRAMPSVNNHKMRDHKSPYGCNMAFRAKTIEHLRFDERLVLYGWLEDRDFGSQAATRAKIIFSNAVWGVHLGTSRGRTSGLRFGYSQVVNPWYLMKKGSMKPADVCYNILRALSSNSLGAFFPLSRTDRWGRLRGNITGIKDIIFGRWAPEKIAGL